MWKTRDGCTYPPRTIKAAMTDKPAYQCGTPERGVVYAWEGEVAGLRAENERLRAALKPFALDVGAVSLSKALGHIQAHAGGIRWTVKIGAPMTHQEEMNMVALSASEIACYLWPDNTNGDKASRADFIKCAVGEWVAKNPFPTPEQPK